MDLPTTHYDNPPIIQDSAPKVAKKNQLEKLSSYIFFFGIFLAPLVFIPSPYAPLDVIKTIFISSFVLISCILYALSSMKSRVVVGPKSATAYAAIGVMISLLVSTFLSADISKSFIGQGFEVGTTSFLFLMFLVAFFVSRIAIKDKKSVFNIYIAIFASFIVLAIFHIVRLAVGPAFMDFGFLTNLTSTIAGKWNDFAILAAVVGLLSFFSIKFFSQEKGLKKIFIASIIVCGAFLLIVNSSFIWTAIAVIVFFVMIYEYRTYPIKDNIIVSRISYFSLIILIISIGLVWKGDKITAPIQKSLKIEQKETTLPWQLTLDVASDTLKESPLFGAGPNRFVFQFLRHKPLELNQTYLWNSEFTNGFGTLPTFVATQGFIGLIVWCLFFVFLVRGGVRILKKTSDPFKKFFVTSSFFTASFLWIINLIYIPSHIIVFLTFLFTGLFFASLYGEGLVLEKETKKYSTILYSIFIIVLVVWLGVYIKKTVAITYFQKGIKELNTSKSVDVAQDKFRKALKWDISDIYYQALSEVNIIKISSLVQEIQSKADQDPSQPLDKNKIAQVGTLMDEAVKYARSAIASDPTNYYNYISEARVSELGASLNIANSYENAQKAYTNALNFNPYNPGIYLSLARLEASQNHIIEAEQNVGKALQLKQNYTEAIFFLSQLQANNGQIKDAITSVQVATQINPNEPILFFQLGLLHYNDKNYSDAVTALAKAVELNSQYANARYFLGLSYVRLGRNEDAITQFKELSVSNPDNKEVAFILSNIEAGKSPFNDVKPPIDSKPEKRKALPVVEKTTSDSSPTSTSTSTKKKAAN